MPDGILLEEVHDVRAIEPMAAEVRAALLATPPRLPSKYFYDDRGSRLFDAITRLEEYYPTRTEEAIIERHAADIVAYTRPREIVELGSGAGRKIRLLLDVLRAGGGLGRLVFFDISERVLAESVTRVGTDYPGLEARGVVGDFTGDLAPLGPGGGRLMLFLAGTLGNLHPRDVPRFLARAAAQLEPGDHFLLGIDLVKDTARLERAYDDAQGVTAEFNRNILRVMNTRLGADFDPAAWQHVAFYDRRRAWIEMRLRAQSRQRVRVPACGLDLHFAAGGEIRTEISCKYTRRILERRLRGTGLAVERWYSDPEELFAVVLLRRAGAPA